MSVNLPSSYLLMEKRRRIETNKIPADATENIHKHKKCCTPEVNEIVYVNYISIKEKNQNNQ